MNLSMKLSVIAALLISLCYSASDVNYLSCPDYICTQPEYTEYINDFRLTGGVRQDCTHGRCDKTFRNSCEACTSPNYNIYSDGTCKADRHYCTLEDRNRSCDAVKTSSVCASFYFAEGYNISYPTASSGCEACKDPRVLYYSKIGRCVSSYNNASNCLPNVRPESCCANKYNPVCGFFGRISESLTNSPPHQIYTNPCTACQDPAVVFHVPGPCVFQCRHDENMDDYDQEGIKPVCGVYKDRGKSVEASIRNSWMACATTPAETYIYGLCQGDEGISCKYEGPNYRPNGILIPVCGETKKGCLSASCRKTYAEPRTACGDPEVLLYKAGVCPEDEGISCDNYRSEKDPNAGQYLHRRSLYENVCGYSKKGCTTNDCRKATAMKLRLVKMILFCSLLLDFVHKSFK